MATARSPFEDFVIDHLSAVGDITVRRMFGGAGVYAQGVMFGLVADDCLYLKADDALGADLADEGSAPFVWTRPTDGKQMQMGYVSLPETALDDAEEAAIWARRALDVALNARAAKSVRKGR